MRFIAFILILAIVGCGKTIYNPEFFHDYVKTFEAESRIYGNAQNVNNLIIRFAGRDSPNLPDTIAGRCTASIGTPLIEINPVHWSHFTAECKEILIFHEMGHCILNLDHDDSKPAIMNTNLLCHYNDNRTGILSDFFKNK